MACSVGRRWERNERAQDSGQGVSRLPLARFAGSRAMLRRETRDPNMTRHGTIQPVLRPRNQTAHRNPA